MLTTYSIGGSVYDGLYSGAMNVAYATDTWHTNSLRRWQQPGDITDVPRIEINGRRASYLDRYLIDASYFAIKNITLGYTLPKMWTGKVGIKRARVYVTGSNLFCITGYSGLDPDVSTAEFTGGFPTPNYDYQSYPKARSFTFGLNLTF
jgi:hypothetical protein